MREGQFIKRNLDRWQSYQDPTEDPDEVAKRFTYLVDDLSYAKTFYPRSSTVKYINSIAANIYLSIYRNKKERGNKLATFFKTELPLAIRRNHRIMLFALLFFLAFIVIGAFSAYLDQNFVRAVLGDGYVDMTEQNIANGHPFAVYDNENELLMFAEIAFNNIKVAFLTYFFGVSAGAGTIWQLFRNGLMVGVFEQMFFHHNLGFKSILVIFTHGTLELSSIVIAGSGGLMLGNAMLFPGTYTRIQALRRAATDSIKIMVCLVPIFIVAAFFEGFVTRHTEMPVWGSLSILISSAAFMIWYFIVYPVKVARRSGNDVPVQ